ncbi:MAG: NAD(P)H-binding protein [Ardenticatenales bacterium]|nr:NAD(P)H-binding protein [Ardenticatenales bacterium]
MRVLVTGGTGELGSEVVRRLAEAGHTPRVMSRRSRPADTPESIEWAQADLRTGEGLREAVRGMEAVAHAATASAITTRDVGLFESGDVVEVQGTHRLLEAARTAGVAHLLYVSIVGAEQVPFGYYQQKVAAETWVRAGSVPWSILRATQFHSLLDRLLHASARLPLVMPLPLDFEFQPIDSREVAALVAEVVVSVPGGLLADVGGPEILTLGEMAKAWLEIHGLNRRLLRLPLPGKAAAAVRRGALTSPNHYQGQVTWREWLSSRLADGRL